MTRAVDLTGERFGRLVALSRAAPMGGRTAWTCQCDCGETKDIRTENLRAGTVQSCGCLRAEVTSERSFKHGQSGYSVSREYRAWSHAKGRCTNPSDPKFQHYGARGIRMCERWIDSFENFLEDMGLAPSGMTLDRKDVNGHYEPNNCRWATTHQQARTRTDNVVVTWGGEPLVLKDLSLKLNINYKRLHKLYRMDGLPLEDAVRRLHG